MTGSLKRRMKFDRGTPKYEGRPISPRRLAMAKRALEREREKAPLFADEITKEQPTPTERILQLEERAKRMFQRLRNFEACQWKRARKLLRTLPLESQRKFLDYWNNEWNGPHTSEYFADLVRSYTKKGESEKQTLERNKKNEEDQNAA